MEDQQVQGQDAPETQQTQGEAQGKPQTGPTGGQVEAEQQAAEERSYTDKDVDKFKGQARKEARNALLSDLGFEKPEDLKQFVSEYRSYEEALQTDAEKWEQERNTLQSELQDAYGQIEQMVTEGSLRNALTEAGIKPERLPLALKVLGSDAVEVDEDGNVQGVEDAVNSVKEQSPEWFNGIFVGRGSSPGPRETPETYEGQMSGFLGQMLNQP